MEKRDLIFLAISIAVVLVLAFVLKPVLSGESLPGLPFTVSPFETPAVPTTTISPTPTPRPVQLVKFANLSGNRSGTSEAIEIPFEFWELVYTAEPGEYGSNRSTSYFPRLKIQVMDARDPSRIVRNLEPDLLDARIHSSYDPRPWRERIAEGNRSYYFVVDIQDVPYYQLEILVPQY